jgi:hypothetical protein
VPPKASALSLPLSKRCSSSLPSLCSSFTIPTPVSKERCVQVNERRHERHEV